MTPLPKRSLEWIMLSRNPWDVKGEVLLQLKKNYLFTAFYLSLISYLMKKGNITKRQSVEICVTFNCFKLNQVRHFLSL